MRLFDRLLLVVSVSLLGACAGSEDASRAATETPAKTWHKNDPSLASTATVRHMHLHAEQLVKLNDALAAGDLEAAATPAYWLSRHDQLEGIPAHWWASLDRMRAAAQVIEETSDIGQARAAAARLAQACNDCHRDNEISVKLTNR